MEVVRCKLNIETGGNGFPVGEYKLAKTIHRCVKLFVTLAEAEYVRGQLLASNHNLTRIVCEAAKKLVTDLELGYSLGKN